MSARDESRDQGIAEALEWIVGVLDDLGVPFQVAGGLAAMAHGSGRPLHDIDIYVPEDALEAILPCVRDHHSHGPRRIRSDHWDCVFLEVHYAGEEIELADASRTRYRAGEGEPWYDADVDFECSVRREMFGVELPVMPRRELVRYKRRLGRDVDVDDLARMGGKDSPD